MADADFPASSAPVVMLSPPDTQDVFHTPPEESLLPSSDVVDVPPCTVNQAVDFDAGSHALSDSSEFVDFGNDSEVSDFGVQSEKVEDGMGNCDEGKVENACKFGEDVLPQSNGVGGEEVNVDSSCREIQMDAKSVLEEDVEMQNFIPEENVETEVVQNDGDVNSNNEIGEGSGTREDLSEEATANGSGFQRSEEEKKFFVLMY
ncbi:hypothetical protein L195_g002197 [Trifolium pratense]|uniref:Uncharacterized protein n=1 Tax=Trifolium pratense TaxID=57577 RepID=A0A2K3NRT1_TRIPR|nr:hypothetical protein L195_g002197 [Trifolium pratense]